MNQCTLKIKLCLSCLERMTFFNCTILGKNYIENLYQNPKVDEPKSTVESWRLKETVLWNVFQCFNFLHRRFMITVLGVDSEHQLYAFPLGHKHQKSYYSQPLFNNFQQLIGLVAALRFGKENLINLSVWSHFQRMIPCAADYQTQRLNVQEILSLCFVF